MELLGQILNAIHGVLKWPLVFGLLATGLFLTVRLRLVQFRRLAHGFAVTSGRYDDPEEPGDVSHFQALTTALSATVGIGNIAGVAIAIHIGGPGALFWMWVTALLGMATKYSEVTLAQHFRVEVKASGQGKAWAGSVAGGPMYYIERGLGRRWKPVAIFFALMLMLTSFMTGNAIQANTIATQAWDLFGLPTWVTGLATAGIVGLVIVGGIRRIGAVTGVLAPLMAALYVLGALTILVLNAGSVLPALGLVLTEAFRPTAGIAGTGAGLFLTAMTYGVQRGLFSNEAGQGSAPIAHSAAKTDEPVSEGVVALLEPLIDTLVICTMTGLVIITTGAWHARVPTAVELGNVNVTYVTGDDRAGYRSVPAPERIVVEGGEVVDPAGPRPAFYDVGLGRLFVDAALQEPFSGAIVPGERRALDERGRPVALHALAVRNSAPLTTLAFERGLSRVGLEALGRWIVLLCVLMFAISTAISWSYYGDRCANYLFGPRAILPYKTVFLVMHFLGAVVAVTTVWDLGDVALSLVTLPNVLALVLLSGLVKRLSDSYFERAPWLANAEAHRRAMERRRGGPADRGP